MAASDARPVPRKNAAWRVYFAIRKNDGTLITTWAGQDSEVSLDGGSFADCTNEATEIGTSGCGYLDLTAAEMNADEVTIKITVTNTSALPLVLTVFPEEAGDYRVADTQKVDVETIKTQALTAAAGITFGVYVGGTAAAAVASTALSTATWTGTLATNIGTTNTTVATNLDATVTSRMATYTQPTGFLAATFPATIASTTNITGGTITTVTNLTNAPTSGDLTATMKASVTAAVPTVAGIADQVWDEAMSGHTTAGTYGGRIVRATNSNTEVQITDSNHIAADVHEFQTGVITAGDFAANSITASALATDAVTEIQSGLATAAALAAAKTILDKVDTGLVVDGAVYQFTANMLELAPAGGGGGGSGDATLAKQEEILTQLDVIQTKTDQIGSAGAITSLLAAAVLEPGTITSFPETLTIGDSYTDQNGRSIQIPIVDTDGNPISSTGSLNFADASVTFTLQRSGETDSTRVITGTASFVDPPGTGTGAGAPYAVVEISSTETAKGLKKYKYSGILTFTWAYAGTGTVDDVMSFETSTVTFYN